MRELAEIVQKMNEAAVMVVGDVMLDIFTYGDVKRISPEGPVPVLSASRETRTLGGAGNVISNLRSLGVKSYLFSVVGNDDHGAEVKAIASSLGANIDGLITDESRPTIAKIRFVAGGQHLLRTDFEKTHALSADQESELLTKITALMPKVQVVVLSDYRKGVLSHALIQNIIRSANAQGIKILVDPKGLDFSIYKGADILTPNRKELSESTAGMACKSDDDIVAAAQKLQTLSGIASIVVTRSEDGMSVVEKGAAPLHLSLKAQEVFDVSGAGDTVIATIAAALACDASLNDAARLSNIAGGIVVGKIGTTPIAPDELLHALNGGQSLSGRHARIVRDWDEARDIAAAWQAQGLKVGFTNGCFDILHYGHVNYLNHARDLCDRLIVGLNHDKSVKILKGPERPVNDETARGTVIGALASVDLVVFFGAEEAGQNNTPEAVIGAVRPDIFFKGGDYKIEDLPEAKIVQSYGGEVRIMNLYEGYSTTSTIEKMRKNG